MPLIKARLKIATSKQNGYADLHRREVVFQERDMVLLKVSPMKGVIQFGKRGKLASRYIRRYEVLQRVRNVSYKLALLLEMERIHPLFHVSIMRKLVSDPNKVVSEPDMEILEDLFYIEQPIWIVDTQVRKLRNKEIPMVKVLWNRHNKEECTWKTRDSMIQ
ncbi:uncharacterized protein LOC131178471 [Hevea brasiliensis]|uniref:uncharacterized protein LOC131178471 n=1 Tax=Hevea brasiliensis TaxID=3981 RepID=UPI0025DDA706|nr:uncharacterized protein LOC131178471 [Hevea brasiliensis]